MSYGGGLYETMNKILPGVYYKILATKSNFQNSEELGIVAVPLELKWGVIGKVFEVTYEDFYKNSLKLFGYSSNSLEMTGFRDLFQNAEKLITYRIGGGNCASCKYASAKYGGLRGNDLKINIVQNNQSSYTVNVLLENKIVETQNVNSPATTDDLTESDFVDWVSSVDLEEETINLSGGTEATPTLQYYQDALNALSTYNFTILATNTTDSEAKQLFCSFVKTQRERYGHYYQCVLNNYTEHSDYEGIISVENSSNLQDDSVTNQIVFWIAGMLSKCKLSESISNEIYKGESEVFDGWTQEQLENKMQQGAFVFHKVGSNTKTFMDINTLKTFDEFKTKIYKQNETIRLKDRLLNSITRRFDEHYLGLVKNTAEGRISLWNDIVTIITDYVREGAIVDFNPNDDVVVTLGENKEDVVVYILIKESLTMQKLYIPLLIQ